jgi:hypothetical protein
MIIGKSEIISMYEHFYSRKYGNQSYKFKPTEKANEEIDKFLNYLDKKYNIISLGNKFLTTYFVFQFKRIDGQVFKRYSSKDKAGKIQIYDIIGRKAIEYFNNRDINFDYTIDTNISILEVLNDHKEQSLSLSEEIEKRRFDDSDRRFINCIERTSLYNNRSPTCCLCSFKRDCKKILQKAYNNIYINRGYDSTAR